MGERYSLNVLSATDSNNSANRKQLLGDVRGGSQKASLLKNAVLQEKKSLYMLSPGGSALYWMFS